MQAKVPFFFKQWGEWSPEPPLKAGHLDYSHCSAVANDGTVYAAGDLSFPDGPRRGAAINAGHDQAHLFAMHKVGKRAAGRMLDGRTWDEFPVIANRD